MKKGEDIGAIIGLVIGVFISFIINFGYVSYILPFIYPILLVYLLFNQPVAGNEFQPLLFYPLIIIYTSLVGILIGWIVSKIKSRNK